ncbi:MAG: DUF7507 domain-containing protein, partial [Chloroflexota bacterium]
MRSPRLLFALAIVFAGALMMASPGARAASSATIDFEGLSEGAIVDSLSSGSGISGDPIPGSVSVFGTNPDVSGNAAMIFDATCTGGCTGGDDDLEKPELGNVLIISEDLDSSDPDDSDSKDAVFEFDYSGFGPGVVTVDSIDVLDIDITEDEGGATVQLFSGGPGGTLLDTVPIPQIGDNALSTIDVGVSGVDYMEVNLNGSGAIDNVEVSVEEPAIDIEKATNGEDADEPTGPEIAVGDPVNWTYVVTNTGDVALTDVSVTDDQGVAVNCPQDTLAVGESMTCA